MRSFFLKEIQQSNSEVLNQADIEPVLLTEESQKSYVIMSVENYEKLMDKITLIEDLILGQQAQAALSNSKMVGSEKFMAELKKLAALDNVPN